MPGRKGYRVYHHHLQSQGHLHSHNSSVGEVRDRHYEQQR
jgi:hypothetical protein